MASPAVENTPLLPAADPLHQSFMTPSKDHTPSESRQDSGEGGGRSWSRRHSGINALNTPNNQPTLLTPFLAGVLIAFCTAIILLTHVAFFPISVELFNNIWIPYLFWLAILTPTWIAMGLAWDVISHDPGSRRRIWGIVLGCWLVCVAVMPVIGYEACKGRHCTAW
jgi:ABC-type spermidine/putrescine transport system permease subunit II